MPNLSALKRHLTRTTLGLALIPALAVCTADNTITSSDDAEAALRRNGTVATVTVSPGNATASLGLTMQFTATAKDGSGNTITNQAVTWSTSDPSIVTVSSNGLATALGVGSATITATIKGRNGSATATVTAAPLPAPGAVNNLSVTGTTTNSATLSFTEVADGSGQAADYEVRYALSPITWSTATRVANGTCAAPLAGTSIGATMTCTVVGLSSNSAYNFQVVAFRGTLSSPVNGALSNVAAASTQSEAAPPPPTPVLTSVAVSPSSASLTVGGTQAYTATARDQNGNVMTGLSVSWSSSNSAVASVTSLGVASAVSAGTAQIVANVSGITGSSTLTVTAAAPPPPAPSPVVTTVTVSPTSASIQTGATQALTATVNDQNGAPMTGQTVTWSSSNPAVASVNSSGVVSGISAGSATITATNSGKTGTSTITVTAPAPPPPSPVVTTISVSPASASIAVAGTQTLTATVKDQNGATMTGQTVTWSSSNSAAATVSAGGVVTGVAAGSATITATSSGKTGTATITVTAPTPVVTTVTVAPSTATILVGATTTLVATVKDQNGATMTGQTVTWSSNNTGRATVNSSGVVTGVSAGAVTITATSSGKSGTASVTVNAPTPVPTTVTVSPSTATIVSGSTTTLAATVKDQNGATMTGQMITWTTSNAIAATVNSSGVVTGVAAGSATITATSSGKTGTASVTVTAAAPPPPPPGSGTLLFSENFENTSMSSRGWYDNTSPALSTTEHIAGSVSSLQFHWTAGATNPQNGGAMRHKFTAGNSFYLSYYVKYSANYVGSGQDYHPHEFHALSNLDDDWTGPADTYMTLYIEQNYQNGGRPKIAMQDNKSINTSMGSLPRSLIGLTENRSVSGCNGVSESNVQTECFTFSTSSGWYNLKGLMGPVTFNNTPGSAGYKNSWNYVEAYFQMNSIVNGVSQADGVMQYWFNGQLVIDRHDIVFRTAARATLMFDKFVIAPYIGDGSPVDQYMWIDNLRVATARIP